MKADVYLVDPNTGEKLLARTYDYDEESDLEPDERMNLAEQAAEDLEPSDGVYLLLVVDFHSTQLFCDRVVVECETSWSVTAAPPGA